MSNREGIGCHFSPSPASFAYAAYGLVLSLAPVVDCCVVSMIGISLMACCSISIWNWPLVCFIALALAPTLARICPPVPTIVLDPMIGCSFFIAVFLFSLYFQFRVTENVFDFCAAIRCAALGDECANGVSTAVASMAALAGEGGWSMMAI